MWVSSLSRFINEDKTENRLSSDSLNSQYILALLSEWISCLLDVHMSGHPRPNDRKPFAKIDTSQENPPPNTPLPKTLVQLPDNNPSPSQPPP